MSANESTKGALSPDEFIDLYINATEANDKNKAQELVDQNRKIAERLANNLGVGAQAAYKDNDMKKAFWLNSMCHALHEQLNDPRGVANAINDLATFYYSMEDYQIALTNFRKAFEIYTRIGDEEGQKAARSNIEAVVSKLEEIRDS